MAGWWGPREAGELTGGMTQAVWCCFSNHMWSLDGGELQFSGAGVCLGCAGRTECQGFE